MEYKYTQPLEKLRVRDSISHIYRVKSDGVEERIQVEFVCLPYKCGRNFKDYPEKINITTKMVRRDLERGLTDYFERGKYNLPFSVDRISREETEKCKDIDSYIILNFDIDSIRGCGDRFIHIHVQQLIQFCKKKLNK